MPTHPSFCRFCHNGCPILVEVQDGRAVRVTGDHDNPVYWGYTCVKGRALPEDHYHPDRLLHSQKRMPDGSYQVIASGAMMDEVAARLRRILDESGPDSVAFYTGTKIGSSPGIGVLCESFAEAIGSRMRFSTPTIDQGGKPVAMALHGMWMAPPQAFDEPDVGLIVGANPLISYLGGLPTGNPGRWLQRWQAKGFQLIVVDPRRTDAARRAALHLQPRPGEDVAILAGMLRVILTEQLHDRDFVATEVAGLDGLRDTVDPFTPGEVARRAGIDGADLVAAARIFAAGERGYAVAGTGPNMSGPGTLIEYLLLCLNTVCGRWLRAGERVAAPFTVQRPVPAKAQAMAPFPGYDLGPPMAASGLAPSLAGMPTGGLATEMLHDGPGRVRALINCGGNPVAAWPDQLHTIRGLEALDLLVQIDVRMSATAKFADYVVAPKMSLEVPSYTAIQELLVYIAPAYSGYPVPWAQWTDAVVEPPTGSDLLEEWEFFYGLAQRMELQLELGAFLPFAPAPKVPLDMEIKPSTEELLALTASGSRIPLEEVRKRPRGALFPDPPMLVEPKDPDCTARLDVANPQMMADLAAVAGTVAVQVDGAHPFRLIPRRMQQAYNSSGRDLAGMRSRPYNPAFMNPADLDRLGICAGSVVQISSQRAAIVAIAKADDTVRPGLVSMAHAFGDVPELDDEVHRIGSNSGRLLTVADGMQPYTGQPQMSNIPVAVRALAWSGEQQADGPAPEAAAPYPLDPPQVVS